MDYPMQPMMWMIHLTASNVADRTYVTCICVYVSVTVWQKTSATISASWSHREKLCWCDAAKIQSSATRWPKRTERLLVLWKKFRLEHFSYKIFFLQGVEFCVIGTFSWMKINALSGGYLTFTTDRKIVNKGAILTPR